MTSFSLLIVSLEQLLAKIPQELPSLPGIHLQVFNFFDMTVNVFDQQMFLGARELCAKEDVIVSCVNTCWQHTPFGLLPENAPHLASSS